MATTTSGNLPHLPNSPRKWFADRHAAYVDCSAEQLHRWGRMFIHTVVNRWRRGMSGTVGERSPGCFCWVSLQRSIPKLSQHRKVGHMSRSKIKVKNQCPSHVRGNAVGLTSLIEDSFSSYLATFAGQITFEAAVW